MSDIHGLPPSNDDDSAFIGRGLRWPLGVDRSGSLALTDGAVDLDRSIQLILMTAPGERVMRPEFGCKIWDYLFEPITPSLMGLINLAVERALAQWEPRVVVDEVVSRPSEVYGDGMVHISIAYRVRLTNDRRNLVYPFYVIPHDAE